MKILYLIPVLLFFIFISCESEISQSNNNEETEEFKVYNEMKILADDKDSDDFFGQPVAIYQNTLAVGAWLEDSQGKTDNGAVYIFVKSGDSWIQSQKLLADDRDSNDFFGCSIAIQKDTLVIGANNESSNGKNKNGAVYIFVKSGDNWVQSQKLLADDKDSNDLFGTSVAIEGDTLAIGAKTESSGGKNQNGAVYIFNKNGNTWGQSQKLLAGDKDHADSFGKSVTIEGDTLVVGAPWEDTTKKNGSVYIFNKNGNTWTQSQKLSLSSGDPVY